MATRCFLVDAFTVTAFRGNPAAVVLLDGPREPEWMQKIAAEFRASETAFLWPEGSARRLRWFTPETEVPLCGHGTLAAAFVLWTQEKISDDTLTFQTASGALTCGRSGEAIVLDLPTDTFERGEVPAALTDALRATPVRFARCRSGNWIAEFETESEIQKLAPDFAALKALPCSGVLATASGDGAADFASRCFFPAQGLDEDPVTGSAHCALGPYWHEIVGKTPMRALQLSTRGGFMEVTPKGNRVELKGRALLVWKGELAV